MAKRKISKNAHIMQIQAKDLFGDSYVVKNHSENRKYKGSFDFSLEMLKLKELNPKFCFRDGRKYFTEDVISVAFNFSIKDENGKVKLSTSDLREELYKNGFEMTIDDKIERFVRYKRSSGSARVGKVLFIKEKYYQEIMDWSYMGIDISPENKIDLASLEAYISLTTSSIIDTLELEPKNILVMDDYQAEFIDTAMATKNVETKTGEKLVTTQERIIIANNIWDGQSLLDKSIFDSSGYGDKSMLLLRNRFFKSACFNTNIGLFMSENNITDVSQVNGFTLATDISDIKLITTPSSLKYMKFGKIEDYLSRLDNLWGIVKYDKSPKYFGGELVSTHYQLINTQQWSEGDMQEFLEPTVDYIKQLRRDYRVMRNHLKVTNKNKVSMNGIIGTNDFIYAMMHTDSFEKTDMYANFRRELIKSYVANVKEGHVLVHGNYQSLFGNPYEMLSNAFGLWDGSMLFSGQRIYTKRFELGEELLGTRSPHVSSSNTLCTNNIHEKDIADTIRRFFNLSEQVVVLNAIDNNVLELLSGADYDSDTMMITNNKVLNRIARKIKFKIANNLVSGVKTARYNTLAQKADLDIKTSSNLIGEIINCSQILNSIKFDMIANGEDVTDIYRDICQLNVMSCIAIDMAKKEFAINLRQELDEIRKRWYEVDSTGEKDKTIKPLFFSHLTRNADESRQFKGVYKKYACGMDMLHAQFQIMLKKKKNSTLRRKSSEKRTIFSLFVDGGSGEYNIKKLNNFADTLEEYRNKARGIWLNDKMDSSFKYDEAIKLKQLTIDQVKSMGFDIEFIRATINTMDMKDTKVSKKLNAHKRTAMAMLFESNRDDFIELFNEDRHAFDVFTTIKSGEEYTKLYGISHFLDGKHKM